MVKIERVIWVLEEAKQELERQAEALDVEWAGCSAGELRQAGALPLACKYIEQLIQELSTTTVVIGKIGGFE